MGNTGIGVCIQLIHAECNHRVNYAKDVLDDVVISTELLVGVPRGYAADGGNILPSYFTMQERQVIHNTLQRQGWYTKLMLDDMGNIIAEIRIKKI